MKAWLPFFAGMMLVASSAAQTSGQALRSPTVTAGRYGDTVVTGIAGGEAGDMKKPAVALALSILVPGAGQVYNGQIEKGALFAGMFYGGIVLVNHANITKSHSSVTAFGWMSVVLIAGTHIINMIDAATTAERIREQNAPSGSAPTFRLGMHELDFGVALGPQSAAFSISLSL